MIWLYNNKLENKRISNKRLLILFYLYLISPFTLYSFLFLFHLNTSKSLKYFSIKSLNNAISQTHEIYLIESAGSDVVIPDWFIYKRGWGYIIIITWVQTKLLPIVTVNPLPHLLSCHWLSIKIDAYTLNLPQKRLTGNR